MSYVNVINDAPEEVHRLVKVIADNVRSFSDRAAVFVVGDTTAVVHPWKDGTTTIHIYDFNKMCKPAAQLRNNDKKDVYTYEIPRAGGPMHIEMDVILETLRALPEMIQARLPGLEKAPE